MAEILNPWEKPEEVDLDLFVSYRDLTLSYLLPTTEHTGFVAPFRNLYDTAMYRLFNKKELKAEFYRIKSLSGYLRPGESTLILAPPGAGATTLLKALTLSLPMSSGDLLFNGLTNDEASSAGADLKRALRYVAQQDTHFQTMTVWESIQFAHRLTSVKPSNAYLEHLLEVFVMEECRNTPTGQISGGQRRRLSTMIGLSNPNARVIAFDCYSDGLDSAAVQRITDYLVAFAKLNNAHFICTLQQPSPLVLGAFDRLVMLKDGMTVYNGPVVDVEAYFSAMGFPCPDDIDLPSHIMHATTNPKLCLIETHLQQVKSNKKQKKAVLSSSSKSPVPQSTTNTSFGPVNNAQNPITTAEEMNEFYLASPFSQHIESVLDQVEVLREKNKLPPTPNTIRRCTQESTQNESTPSDPIDTNRVPVPLIAPNTKTSVLVSEKAHVVDFIPQVLTPNTLPFFSKGYATSIYTLLVLVLYRQLLLNWRGRTLMMARLIPAIVISFVVSGTSFQLPIARFSQRFAGFDAIIVEYAYSNMIEISLSIAARPLILNQLDLYPTWVYAASVQIASIPFSLLETFVFTVISYSMMDHSHDPLCIFTYYFLLWINGAFLASFFRFGASIAANTSQAYAIIAPAIALFAFCSGFYIKPPDLEWPMRALYWVGPFSSAFRALAINEMTSSRYDYLIPSPSDPSVLQRAGDVYLRLSKLPTDQVWMVASAIYAFTMIVLMVLGTAYFLYRPYAEYSIGTRRFVEETDMEEFMNAYQTAQEVKEKDHIELLRFHRETQQQADLEFSRNMLASQGNENRLYNDTDDVEMSSLGPSSIKASHQDGNQVSSIGSQFTSRSVSRSRFASGNAKLQTLTNDLPFTPATLSFKDIRFTVQAANDHGKIYDRVLLQDISGYAMPGTTTALMGSSGAGKSTLLNTLIGLNKTTGTQTVEGQIYVNGQLLSPTQFASICGYCEQFETLYPYDTVFETLMFSARMRLGTRDVETLTRVVNEVISILELDQVRDHLIGNSENPVLSQSQRKLVSIGIELTGNPSILFLDEPTTGLSSESAITVCRAISQVARSGRAIICTIHQPSSQIFLEFFDNLLLLGSGGYTMYFGRLGNRASNLINYFGQVDGFAKFPQRTNPAEHMVETVSLPLASNLISTAETMYNEFFDGTNSDLSNKIASWSSLSPKQQNVFYLYLCYQSSDLRQETSNFLNIVISDKGDTGAAPCVGFANQTPQLTSSTHSAEQSPCDTPTEASSAQLVLPHDPSSASPFGLSLDTTTAMIDKAIDENEQEKVPIQFDSSPVVDPIPSSTIHCQDLRPGFRPLPQNRIDITPYSAPTDFQGHQQQELRAPAKSPFWYQVYYVVNRQWHLYTRNTGFFWTRMGSGLCTKVLHGLLYLGITLNEPGSLVGFFASTIFTTNLTGYLIGTTILPIYNHLNRTVFYREQHYHYYNPIIWTFAWFVCELIWVFPVAIISPIPIYFMTGSTNRDFGSLAATLWAGYVTSIVISNYALMLSLTFPTVITEIILNLTLTLMFALQAVSIPRPNATSVFKALMLINPFYYVNRAVTDIQFRSRQGMILIYQNGVSSLVPIRDWILDYTGFVYGSYWWSFLWLCCFIAVFYSIATMSAIFIRLKS